MSDQTAVIKVYMQSQIFQILVTMSAADETYLLGTDFQPSIPFYFAIAEKFLREGFIERTVSASVGGIFSLFLGCSFLSVVEIVYFLYLFCRSLLLRGRAEAQPQQTSNKNFVNHRRQVY